MNLLWGRAWFALGVLFLVGGGSVLAWVWWKGAPPAAQECVEQVWFVSDDGERLPVDLFRCQPREGEFPALVVWTTQTARTRRAVVQAFDAWTREGRSLWVVQAPVRETMARRDLDGLLKAVATDPGSDGDKIALLLAGAPADLLLESGEPVVPDRVAALVVIDSDGDPGSAKIEDGEIPVTKITARRFSGAAKQAASWLAQAMP